MNDTDRQPARAKAVEAPDETAASDLATPDEEQLEARKRAKVIEKLALRVLDECRVSLMLSFRYLDIALWKLPFVARLQKAPLATDGTSLFFNPDLVVMRFRTNPNELIRDYLHVVLHCVLRHPFETHRRIPQTWSLACDVCVEAIAMEMCEHLYPSADDEERAYGLQAIRHEVDAFTPARIYRSIIGAARTPRPDAGGREADGDFKRALATPPEDASRKGAAWTIGDSIPFLEAVEQMRSLFWRDDHEPWNLLKLNDDPDGTSPQDGSQGGHTGPNEEGRPEDQEQPGAEDQREAETGESEADGAGSDSPSDGAGDQGGKDEAGDAREDGDGDGTCGDGEAGDTEGNAPEESPRSDDGARDRPAPDRASMAEAAAAAAAEAAESDDGASEGDTGESGGQAPAFAPLPDGAGQADVYGYVEKDLREIVNMARLSEVEWIDIGKRIEADLRTMSSMRGTEAGTFMANLALVNRSRIDYAEFLRRFSTPVEDANMSDDEFDYIYYLYGLNRYGNIPLVEPLESRETFRVRDFVIALDTSGSTTGELERLFVTRTLELLKQSAHRGEEVNIHVIQCDSKIRKVTVITDIGQLDAIEDTIEVYGMGGTDFRPVFAYVDDLLQQGQFGNLRGLLYFTDGMGVFPSSPPPYDTAFVFVEEEGKEMKVPPWAMRVVLDEDMIREW